jgi:hypothetical protein
MARIRHVYLVPIADVHQVWKRPPNVRLVRNFDQDTFLALFLERMAALARQVA